jgi:DNA gyrase subunit A
MEIGTVRQVDIDEQMRGAYLDYAMSVIVSRALPDACDGLKPVQRRILHAMHEMGVRSNTAYRKSARIVGEVMGKYHPHGGEAIYDAMARLAQDFSMRYPLVDPQGNFGSIDGDPPAAMRYTEARLARTAEELLQDIDMNTVDFVDNFDAALQEPVVLPARLPNLLLNGASGIAVGMATNIPPHNLGELAAAITYLVDNYDRSDDVTVDDLMKFVQGPDFPTGGMIVGSEGILQAYSTGKGRIVARGIANIEETSRNRHRIVITEIPFQVNKTSLIERIAELVRDGRLDDISDLRDESDRRGLSVVLELKRGAQPKKVVNQLFKFTQLQTTFGVQLLALVGGEPRLLSLKRALMVYIEHRRTVIIRRTQFELEKARARAHILDGLMIALANLDEVISTIRKAADADKAKTQLMKRFKLSDLQAQAILDLQLRRLAALERKNIQKEHKEVLERIGYLEDLLGHPKKILALIKSDLKDMVASMATCAALASRRRQQSSRGRPGGGRTVLISITEKGYVKRCRQRPTAARAAAGEGRGTAARRRRSQHAAAGRHAGHAAFLLRPGQGLLRESLPDPGRRPYGARHPHGEHPGTAGGGGDHRRGPGAGLQRRQLLHHGHPQRPHQTGGALGIRGGAAIRADRYCPQQGGCAGLGAADQRQARHHPGYPGRPGAALLGETGAGHGSAGSWREGH